MQDVHGKWLYKGGTRYIDSVRVNMTYAEVAFRWSEKVNSDLLELKYKLPEDDLDPDQLITVRDDTDLQVRSIGMRALVPPACDVSDYALRTLQVAPQSHQTALSGLIVRYKSYRFDLMTLSRVFLQEMIKEYFGGVAKSKAAACSRLSVYLFFDLNQEPLTPAEYQDGCTFFRSSR